MKKIIVLLIIVLPFTLLKAQNIKFKKGIVYIDGVECLKYDNSAAIVFTNMDETQTVILKYIRKKNKDFYTKVIFVEQRKSLITKTKTFSKKYLIKRFLKDGVLNDCDFDDSKIDFFILKYEEGIDDI